MHKTIGVLGGTFDPVHYGHLSIVVAARDELALDRVLLMPAHVSPFKLDRKTAPEEDRIAMLRLAAEDLDRVEVSTLETDSDEISYTYLTLTRLAALYPEDRILFLMGTDSFLDLERWHKGPELLRQFAFGLAPRPGFDRAAYEAQLAYYREKYDADVTVLQNELVPVSSTEVREAVRTGKDISGYLPEKVKDYIYEHGLYR